MDRYKYTKTFQNSTENYEQLLQDRNLSSVNQYTRFDFKKLSQVNLIDYKYITHSFGAGDRLENLAYDYYGDSSYWWVICYTNRISSPLEIEIGTTLYIYYPIDKIVGLLNNGR